MGLPAQQAPEFNKIWPTAATEGWHLLGGDHGVGEAVVIAPCVLLVHQVAHIKVLDLHKFAESNSFPDRFKTTANEAANTAASIVAMQAASHLRSKFGRKLAGVKAGDVVHAADAL